MADFIREHWSGQALKHGASHWASWGDIHAINLEIATIANHIRDGDVVLDVGCGNGFAAFKQARKHNLSLLTGIDIAPAMIAEARATREVHGITAGLDFFEGDARSLTLGDTSYDVVYTTRCLINLPTWDEQALAIGECLRIASRKVILCEAFWEPLQTLNAMRQLVQLPPLVEHDFNRYLKKSNLEAFLRKAGLLYTVEDFSSIYYLGSRLLRELVTNPDAYPGYTNPINQVFYEIEREYSGGGFGIQQAYVINKEPRL